MKSFIKTHTHKTEKENPSESYERKNKKNDYVKDTTIKIDKHNKI